MKQAPYTTSTGIKMGCRWNESPKPMVIDDPDMERVQSWLICDEKWHKDRSLERIAYAMSGFVALIVICFLVVAK